MLWSESWRFRKLASLLGGVGVLRSCENFDKSIECSSRHTGLSHGKVPSRSARYVVVGSGTEAGMAALEELHSSVPSRHVLALKSAVALDVSRRLLELEDGEVVGFGDCLIAAGRYAGSTNPLVRLGELEGSFDPLLFKRDHAVYLDDAGAVDKLKAKVRVGSHVTLIGGSTIEFRTLEVAMALAAEGRKAGYMNVVSVVCPSTGVLSQVLPRYLSMALNRRLNAMGVEVIRYAQIRYVAGTDAVTVTQREPGEGVAEDEKHNKANIAVFCSHAYDGLNTASFETDAVALAGVSTHVGRGSGDHRAEHWGLRAGLERGAVGGIAVNRSLQAASGVWVAGDIANVDIGHKAIGRGTWTGTEHSKFTGRVAARNMLGGSEMYSHLPANHLVCRTARERGGDSVGIDAGPPHVSLTTVGHCSAAQETHGYWWARGADGNGSSGTSNGGVSVKHKRGPESDSNRNSSGVKETPLSMVIQDQLYRYIGQRRPKEKEESDSGGMSSEDMRINARGKAAMRRVSEDKGTTATNSSSRSAGSRSGGGGGRKQKASPTRPPLGRGIVFYVNNSIVTGMLLSGLVPPDTHDADSRGRSAGGGDAAYAGLVEESKQFIGVNVEPYYDFDTGASTTQGGEGQQQTQAVFLFGNPSGKGHVSTASQLERIATVLVKRHSELMKGEEVDVVKPQYRPYRASMELQRSSQESVYSPSVVPQPALREKITSGQNSNSTYSNKERVKAAYSSAMKGNDVVRALGGAWKDDK